MNDKPLVRFDVVDGIGVVTIDNPPVNALGPGVRDGITEALEKGEADPKVKVMVMIGAGRSFIAGADIRQFGKPRPVPKRSPYDVMDGGTKPVVRPSTATRWAAVSSTRLPATTALPCRAPRWACPRCSSAFCQVAAARSACRVSSARRRRWR